MSLETQIELATQSFEVVDVRSADWVVRKIAEARARQEMVKVWAREEVERAQAEETHILARFGPQVEAVVVAELEKTRGKKSIALPAGTVGFRLKPDHLEVRDEEAALNWARTNCPQAVKTVERLAKSELNAHFLQTGEVPEGTTFCPAQDEFYVR